MSADRTIKKIAFTSSQKPEAQLALRELTQKYGNHDASEADVIVALGGDGFMLETLRRNMTLIKRGLPVYGMNKGTIGFLMNAYVVDDLTARIEKAEAAIVRPLEMQCEARGGSFKALAINEISLLRQTRQAAHLRIVIDGRERLDKLIADGVLVATPAGSTAYNLSAHGPVLPLGSDILALTPISAFRPRRWRGALLRAAAEVEFEVLSNDKRPVSATADDQEFRDVSTVIVRQAKDTELTLLFDEDHGLDEKMLREQFIA